MHYWYHLFVIVVHKAERRLLQVTKLKQTITHIVSLYLWIYIFICISDIWDVKFIIFYRVVTSSDGWSNGYMNQTPQVQILDKATKNKTKQTRPCFTGGRTFQVGVSLDFF